MIFSMQLDIFKKLMPKKRYSLTGKPIEEIKLRKYSSKEAKSIF